MLPVEEVVALLQEQGQLAAMEAEAMAESLPPQEVGSQLALLVVLVLMSLLAVQ